MNRIFRPLGMLCLAAGLLAGCGDNATQNTEADQIEDYAAAHGVDADVRTDADGRVDSVAINQGGGQVGSNLDVPDGFPSDIPLYPGLNLYGASAVPGGGFSLAALSDDDVDTISAWYASRMTQGGWTASDAPQGMPGQSGLIFEKGNRRVMVTLTPGSSGTTMSLVTLALG